jgi:signal transduction histidine kinase
MKLVLKFVVVLSLSLFVTFSFFVVAASYTGTGILDQFDSHRSREVSDIIEAQIRTIMLEKRPEHLNTIIESVGNSPAIESVLLLSDDGSVIRSSSNQDTAHIPYDRLKASIDSTSNGIFASLEDGKEYMYASVPITRLSSCTECHGTASGPIAYLAVKTSKHSFADITNGHRNMNIILTAGVFLVLAIIISVTVMLVVVRPLKRFSHNLDDRLFSLQNRSENHELAPVKYMAGDSAEIMHMVERFNELSSQLNKARREIEENHRKQLEDAQSLGYLGEMAAHTAHEIKNPLAGIRGSLQTIGSKMPDGSQHREIIQRAVGELERIYQTMMDLLTTAKGKPPEFKIIQINSLINDIVRVAEKDKQEKNLSFTLGMDPSLPPIEADRNIISQVIWNLVSNAIDAVSEGGKISISTRRAGGVDDSVAMIVKDDGFGIPEEAQKNIFKPFITGKEHGTGLGLSVVRRAVEAHGGSIALKSVAGRGSAFTVTLPLKQRREPSKEQSA